jgi:hypothetical protein
MPLKAAVVTAVLDAAVCAKGAVKVLAILIP